MKLYLKIVELCNINNERNSNYVLKATEKKLYYTLSPFKSM